MTIQEFRGSFHGELLEPADAGHESARKFWNAVIDNRSSPVALVAAVNYGRVNGLLTAIRGGGHNVGGRALCDDGIVIDLSRMRAVYADPAARTVRVQGGATPGDMDRVGGARGNHPQDRRGRADVRRRSGLADS